MSDPERFVAYYRMPAIGVTLSTTSLAHQRQAITTFLEAPDRVLVGEFTEIMAPSFEGEIPPAFQLALDCCCSLEACILTAVGVSVMGAAEQALAKQRGVAIHFLDNRAGAGPPIVQARAEETIEAPYLDLKPRDRHPVPMRERTPAGNRAKADQFAEAILPIIEQIQASGATTLTDIARELNARQVRTARGRRWYPMTVRNILQRNREL